MLKGKVVVVWLRNFFGTIRKERASVDREMIKMKPWGVVSGGPMPTGGGRRSGKQGEELGKREGVDTV